MREKFRELQREIRRKAFHLLSLLYLAAFWILGYPRVLFWMLGWTLFIATLEIARLFSPQVNKFLNDLFRDLARPEENRRVSGAFHTAAGALLVLFFFGQDPRVVSASLFYAAFGDAAAALVGKSIGQRRLPFSKKSLEGSLACFMTCLLIGEIAGFPLKATAFAAATGTIIEFLPTTVYFNDNLWMPIATAAVLRWFGI